MKTSNTSRELRLRFGLPEHGWLPCALTLPGREAIGDDVSDAGPDSLAMLVDALRVLSEGGTRQRVEWYLEPSVWVWELERSGGRMRFEAFLEAGPWTSQRVASDLDVAPLELPFATCLRAFVDGLEETAAEPCWTRDRKHEGSGEDRFDHAFPFAKLEALRAAIART